MSGGIVSKRRILGHQDLQALDEDFHTAWTGAGSTPFLADIRPSQSQFELAVLAVKQVGLSTLLDRYPTLAIWAVLHPLSLHYGESTSEVYSHVSNFSGEDFSDSSSREILKGKFRLAARKLGLPVSGNEPSTLFFPPLGPARAQHRELAKAFVQTALRSGPPAIEDTTAARRWQRVAVIQRCPNHPRLRDTIHYDASAYSARQFQAWRQGELPHGEGEAHLFSAFDEASEIYGTRRTNLVGAPKIFWAGDLLGLQADRSSGTQWVRMGVVPTRISGGQRLSLPAPWPEKITWSSATFSQEIALAPTDREALVFDADTGQLISRVPLEQAYLEVAAERLVVLSAASFASPSFGEAIPAKDDRCNVAWVVANEVITFADGGTLSLRSPSEGSVWLDGAVIGREGGRALYASEGAIVLRVNTEVGGATRVIRATVGNDIRFFSADFQSMENCRIDFAKFGLGSVADPVEVKFDVLAPGAAGDPSARAELSTKAWVWPGFRGPGEPINIPVPSNYNPARSAGMLVRDGLLSVNERADVETPILGLEDDGGVHEFELAAQSEKLWHCRIQDNDKVYVPRGSVVIFGYSNRHDTLMLRSPDREASLILFGHERYRPFRQRSSIEIPSSALHDEGDDDRVALRRRDGRVDLLAHIRRVDDPGTLILGESESELSMAVVPRIEFDGLRVSVESMSGEVLEGDYSFGRNPSEFSPLVGVTVSHDFETGRLDVKIDRTAFLHPSRVLFAMRSPGGSFTPLQDGRGIKVALGLSGCVPPMNLGEVTTLARFLAEPEVEALWGQLSTALTPSYYVGMKRVGASKMLGSVKSIINAARADNGSPRHDLIGVAPWIFEAPATAFTGLSEASGLYPLNQLHTMQAPSPLPSLSGDEPLGLWLDRVGTDLNLPEQFGVGTLQHAFRSLRYRLRETDLRSLVGRDSIGRSAKLINGAHVDAIDKIRSFDTGGGGDDAPARIAVQVERFARACAQRQVDNFVEDLVFRTGLSRQEVGRLLTLMVRAAVEFFAYFRAIWSFAIAQA
ncbi:hypothetical protein [Devosia sp. A449]